MSYKEKLSLIHKSLKEQAKPQEPMKDRDIPTCGKGSPLCVPSTEVKFIDQRFIGGKPFEKGSIAIQVYKLLKQFWSPGKNYYVAKGFVWGTGQATGDLALGKTPNEAYTAGLYALMRKIMSGDFKVNPK